MPASDRPRPRPHWLPQHADVPESLAHQVRKDFGRFADGGLPLDLEGYVLATYGLDVTGSYAGRRLRNPFGKASGQLSMRMRQIEEAADAGLGFTVLKTVIAEDAAGGRSMGAWAIKESRMVAEPIVGRESGVPGWTITWKGRGWWGSLDDYLQLVRDAAGLGRDRGMLVVPSVKYHLPAPGEDRWRTEEYVETTRRLLDAYPEQPMPLEKDFSPTLAGSDRARQRAKVLEWLAAIPALIRQAAAPRKVQLGLKLFNALDDEAFQLTMLEQVHESNRPDFLIYANRLFDPDRVFDGHRGVAYGGPDLSDRNLRALSALRVAQSQTPDSWAPLEISATGDIGSGRMAIEYALRGCTSFQIHTFFQLPPEFYTMKRGTKLERALHMLYFHPDDGLIVWAWHAARRLQLDGDGSVGLLDLAARGACSAVGQLDAQPS